MESKNFDVNQLKLLVGESLFEEFVDSIFAFIRPDDSDYVKSVKQKFIQSYFRHLALSLRSSNNF